MSARAERGRVSNIPEPDPTASNLYAALMARGVIKLKATTTSDLDSLPRYRIPDDVSPLDALLAEREREPES
ncbi:hypothetical protein ACFOX0_21025 [Micromonospora zhanjiangensis]|uniref:Uncharacterized protein n=1 Tax=Micromonospora zhanjiangensis TaxID=1522057 RepID=A0ABV8KQY2_9ACTN